MKKIKLIALTLILIIIVSCISFKIWVRNNVKEQQVPVLMYHNVVKDKYYKGQADTISLSTFEKQLKYLKDNNYKTLTLDEFYCWKQGECDIRKKSVVLTFDDGFYSFHYLVEPLLEEYDFHAINFLIGNTIEETTKDFSSKEYGTIGKDFIKEHSKYVDYQSHSFSMHSLVDNKQKIYTMTKEEFQEDINNMKEISDFEYLSYPFNTETDEFIEILESNGYKLAFRGENEKATSDSNNYQISRIGIQEDFEYFKSIFETDIFNNRYGNGFLRKIFITIERILNIKLG